MRPPELPVERESSCPPYERERMSVRVRDIRLRLGLGLASGLGFRARVRVNDPIYISDMESSTL
jgi:hypothetical protein